MISIFIRCIIDDINDDYLGFLKNQERVAVSGEIDFDKHNKRERDESRFF